MYLALVSAEEAGLLPNVLERESKLLESLARIKGQINSALAYINFYISCNCDNSNVVVCYTSFYSNLCGFRY